jgi:hypothetical protein
MISLCELKGTKGKNDDDSELHRGPFAQGHHADGCLVVCGVFPEHTPCRSTEAGTQGPCQGNRIRSSWIPGSSAPTWSEHRNSFLRALKTKGFTKERVTKVRVYDRGTSTTLESNKSLRQKVLSLIESPRKAKKAAQMAAACIRDREDRG